MKFRRFIIVALTMAISALGVAAPAQAAPAKPFPYCSWWLETTPVSMNVAFPDTSATYWTTPYLAEPGMKIRIDGTFPETRFLSFTVYDNTFGYFTNGVESQLTDYQIAPNAGSANPWATNAAPNTPAGGAFTLTLQPTVAAGDINALPILPTNPTKSGDIPANMGFLVMRVYLPTGDLSDVPLPRLTIIDADGGTSPLNKCTKPSLTTAQRTHHGAKAVKLFKKLQSGPQQPPCDPNCPAPYQFFRATASTTGSFFPNSANAYLSMLFTPAKGQVVVVRFLAPTSPYDAGGTGSVPVPWPDSSDQVRYWSVCNNVYAPPYPVVANPKGKKGTTYGCVADNAAVRSSDGYVTVVIAKPASRPSNANTRNGYNFLPTSVAYPKAMEMVALRNMLASDTFTNSALYVPQNASASSAQQVMGAYYPKVTVCTKAQFEAGGAASCTTP